MRNNNQSNAVIKWLVIGGDFLVLNFLIFLLLQFHPQVSAWTADRKWIFLLVCNLSLIGAEYRFYTVIHRRLVSVSQILPRIIWLTMVWTLAAYLLLRTIGYNTAVGHLLLFMGTLLFVALLLLRYAERWVVKQYRQAGRNTRQVTLVGSDPELDAVKEKLMSDPTLGYRIVGEYADAATFEDLLANHPDDISLGDELYLCVSRRARGMVRHISLLCEQRVVRFFYVPVSVESLGIDLKRELLDDMEIYTTYENPLQRPVNRAVKRAMDLVLSVAALLLVGLLLPIIYCVVKWQSPGPLFFRQLRTGLDGRSFYCYKFRSMHVNQDADRKQAMKDDPRKFPFGNFMRKTNIDELPQFWNVLKGDMSAVGPRPHMLAHTELYSKLVDKYMVRHFVKPGVTGWAQVTGYRGETKELWQMEGRVKRDIWYIEHWTVWLDIRIIWLTLKSVVVRDKNAY